MWQKDDYQEHMLGYLNAMQNELARHTYIDVYQSELNPLFITLDSALEWLWQLIEARDDDWELCRYPLEASCARLLREFYRLPETESPLLAAHPTREHHQRDAELLRSAEIVW